MDRRKRALGLRKHNGYVEVNGTNSKDVSSKSKAKTINMVVDGEGKIVKEGVDGQRVQAENVTPKQCTPKRNSNIHIGSLKSDSPCSPLLSPGYQSMFPRTLGSPEIEVSWDWGCSQVPKDMLPKRRVKRTSQSQPPPLSVPLVTPVPRLLLDKQISEEENQERLAFYKNVLSQSLNGGIPGLKVCSKNNNLEKEFRPGTTTIVTTPKHLPKSLAESGKKEEQINAFFDDSANEFMMECSQAIEEKLKNGEIDMGPLVNIKIPNQKHAHSPTVEEKNAHKRVCYSRPKLNLFPESHNNVDKNTNHSICEKRSLSLKSPQSKQLKHKQSQNVQTTPTSGDNVDLDNDDDLFMRTTQPNLGFTMKKSLPNGTPNCENNNTNLKATNNIKNDRVNININHEVISKPVLHSSSDSKQSLLNRSLQGKHVPSVDSSSINNGNYKGFAQNICNKNVQKNLDAANDYDRVNKFRKPQNGNPILSAKQSTTDPHQRCDIVINKPTVVPNPVVKKCAIVNQTHNVKSGQENGTDRCQGSKSSTADITSLLDDGFDMELSNLDFDSLCCSSEPKEFKVQTVIKAASKTAPKLCSQQEIEAKRVAALNRLMLKKRK